VTSWSVTGVIKGAILPVNARILKETEEEEEEEEVEAAAAEAVVVDFADVDAVVVGG